MQHVGVSGMLPQSRCKCCARKPPGLGHDDSHAGFALRVHIRVCEFVPVAPLTLQERALVSAGHVAKEFSKFWSEKYQARTVRNWNCLRAYLKRPKPTPYSMQPEPYKL